MFTWRQIYEQVKGTRLSVFFYKLTDKKYYSLNSNLIVYVHKYVNTVSKIVKEKQVDLSNSSIKQFTDYMDYNYKLGTYILSPKSQLRLHGDEATCVDSAPSIRDKLRSVITSIIGESQFRSISARFSEEGLVGNYSNLNIGALEKSLIAWIDEVDTGSVVGIENIFFLYDQLFYPECIRELLATLE